MKVVNYRQAGAICFTCGAEAHMTVKLIRGCAAFPNAHGYVGLCPQHEMTLTPIEGYEVIERLADDDVGSVARKEGEGA